MINLIHVFGAPGSGVTSIGRAVAQAYGCAFLDLDATEFTDETRSARVPEGDRLLELANALDTCGGQAVVAGDLCGWGAAFATILDCAVFVFAPEELRLARLLVREKAAFGDRVRPDGDLHEMYQSDLLAARKYAEPSDTVAESSESASAERASEAAAYPRRSLSSDEAWRASLECPVLLIDGAKPVSESVDVIMKALCENDFPDGVEPDYAHAESHARHEDGGK